MKFSHFGITVSDVLAAEKFYCAIFGMEVFVREVRTASGWKSLEPDTTPEEAAACGFDVGMVVLQCDGLGISLSTEGVQRATLLEHAAFVVDASEFAALRERTRELGCQLLQETPRRFVFVDPHAMVWEFTDRDRLYSARDMGYGWVDRSGLEHPSLNLLEMS